MRYDISELRSLVVVLEDDLHAEVEGSDELREGLQTAWQDAVDHFRTGDAFEAWLDGYLTQVAVAWVVTSVFVRFLEDNALVHGAWIAGEGRAGEDARDRTDAYFREHPAKSETDYLLHVFEHFASLPAGELFGPKRNALYRVRLSADAGRALLGFWRAIDPDTGLLRRKFQSGDDGSGKLASNGDGSVDTRFLGDLYQDLSDHAKKKFALLQTPDFVEEYILDYTLEPAIETFGLDAVRFIDPTCGSGHFLLGGFHRIFQKKLAAKPGTSRAELVREALEATHGVDLNPFAVVIARFRLLIAAMTAVSEDLKLDDTQDFPLHIAVADTLLHGKRFERFVTDATKKISQLELDRFKWDPERWSTEDNDLIDKILGQQYHAVVGNPPYITPKDEAARNAYRDLYQSCHRQYALVCPFTERFFELAGGERLGEDLFSKERWTGEQAGYVGLIVANSFMKREFGSKLIENLLPHVDLTHVIDTSGAYIPGHGTPTVILFGRNQDPQSGGVRAVLGIRGEPKTPNDPRQGKVWSSIADHTDDLDFENDFVTVSDLDRPLLHTHPWSLRGGGALQAKAALDLGRAILAPLALSIGRVAHTGNDDGYVADPATLRRHGVAVSQTAEFIEGAVLRDYSVGESIKLAFPYDQNLQNLDEAPETPLFRWLWRNRELLWQRREPNGTHREIGFTWHQLSRFHPERFVGPGIAYAFVATHNHFVLDRGGKVFNRSAPVIKLPAEATEDDHLGLLGLLNSSTACFWMKQVFFNKGYGADSKGARMRDVPFEDFYEFDGTKIKQFPLTEARPFEVARRLDDTARELAELKPSSIADKTTPRPQVLEASEKTARQLARRMVALQEELDWQCYELYELLEQGQAPLASKFNDLPEVKLGERAFEIVIARKMESGEADSTWFERHGSTPITETPAHWPAWYRELVQRRIDLIEQKRFIRLIEQPEYKRRWNRDSWEEKEQAALRGWLLDRLESPAYVPQADREGPGASQPAKLMRITDLADIAANDADFMTVAERYTHNPNVRPLDLVETLLKTESVPFLPAQRYKKKGFKKRKQWEKVWDLQRREDAGESVKIPKPPKYTGADFAKPAYYKLRGKLDVPKERFTSYPGLELDGHAFVTWAGLDHKQRAQALATFYYEARDASGFDNERLATILAGIKDLVPWVKQWHNDVDPAYGIRFGDFLESFVTQQAAELGVGVEAVEKARLA